METKKIVAGRYTIEHNGGRIGSMSREYVPGHRSCAGTSKGIYEWCVDIDSEDGTKRFDSFDEAREFVLKYAPPRYWLSFVNNDTVIMVDGGKRIGIAQKGRHSDKWGLLYDETPDDAPLRFDIFELESHVRNMNKTAQIAGMGI